jgi:hydrogenase expression/formation protein HypC
VTVAPPAGQCAADGGHCITCSDEGVPMRVVSAQEALAVCRDDERRLHDVAIDLVAPVSPGDRVLVHAGVAIAELEP